jgi:hypothetical protein
MNRTIFMSMLSGVTWLSYNAPAGSRTATAWPKRQSQW